MASRPIANRPIASRPIASRPIAASTPSLSLVAAAPAWRVALIVGAVLAAAAVAWFGQHDAAARARRAADPDLLALLRLMAGIKAGAAVAMLWLAQWRLRRAAPPVLACGMVAGGMLMVSGPVLIWTMAGMGLGVLAFYAGLVSLGALLWSDRGTILDMMGALRPR